MAKSRKSSIKPRKLCFCGTGDGKRLCYISADGKRLRVVAVFSGGHSRPLFESLRLRGLQKQVSPATKRALEKIFACWSSETPVHRWFEDLVTMGAIPDWELARLWAAARKSGWVN